MTYSQGSQISSDEIREIFVLRFIHANSPMSAYSHTVYCTYIIKPWSKKACTAISAKMFSVFTVYVCRVELLCVDLSHVSK